ncbi:MAG: sel1 repeat family protein [Robiginitomaculum sp.]|nr:sel1 repeat family protein [Robiginitomaculum sp.]
MNIIKKLILVVVMANLCAFTPLAAISQTPLQDGFAAFEKKDYTEARAQLEPLSKNGNEIAQYLVGILHENGWGGFAKSSTEAFRLYILSANQDFESAYEYLADMYYFGNGTSKDFEKAFKWYAKIPDDQKNGLVLKRIGDIYDEGLGRPKNPATAVVYYQKSADKGYSLGQVSIGYMLEIGRGVDQDQVRAVSWYRKAADQGNARAQTNLGNMYETGNGVTQSYGEAAKWFRKAADQGYPRAQKNLGYFYEKGLGVPQSYSSAVAWYRKAADQGNAGAQYNLGVAYFNGNGVLRNKDQVIAWIKKAAAQDHKGAQAALKQLGVH